MIKFELLSLKCLGINLNWKDKIINIREYTKYIIATLEHYKLDKNIGVDVDVDNILQIPFTNSDLSKFWINNISVYSNIFQIDFKNLIYDTDYIIAPLHLSKCLNKNIIIIGIILLDYKFNTTMQIDKYTFMSTIKPLPKTQICHINKYNIISGILNYNKDKANTTNTNIYLLIDNMNISLNHILYNACNYLPKFEININSHKHLQNCFKIS
jgi:hypothetical protein